MNIDRQLRRAEQEPAHIKSTELYAVLAQEIMAPEGTCRTFAIHPDRTTVLVDMHGHVTTLRPGVDGLYDLGPLGDIAACTDSNADPQATRVPITSNTVTTTWPAARAACTRPGTFPSSTPIGCALTEPTCRSASRARSPG